jgi:hypothetical protein
MKNCPFCGRPIAFEEKYLKVIWCPYCNSILEFWSWELVKVWEQSEFIDFPSIFQVWKETEYNWLNIYVKWQLRYEYDWGFFDKFFCIIDGKEYYIKEDDWVITIFKEWDWQNWDISIWDMEVWSTTNFMWKNIFIQETWFYKLVNIKWYVNTLFTIWKQYQYLNWIYNWNMIFVEKSSQDNNFRISEEINM